VVYWCNSYTIVHFSLDIIEWFKYKLKRFLKLYLILIHPPLSINKKRVRHVVTRLKGHATLWWDELQAERTIKGKQKIKNWDRMVSKLKEKFMPKDY
jgi:hypothetical protein